MKALCAISRQNRGICLMNLLINYREQRESTLAIRFASESLRHKFWGLKLQVSISIKLPNENGDIPGDEAQSRNDKVCELMSQAILIF